jgi:hypothetical protein
MKHLISFLMIIAFTTLNAAAGDSLAKTNALSRLCEQCSGHDKRQFLSTARTNAPACTNTPAFTFRSNAPLRATKSLITSNSPALQPPSGLRISIN